VEEVEEAQEGREEAVVAEEEKTESVEKKRLADEKKASGPKNAAALTPLLTKVAAQNTALKSQDVIRVLREQWRGLGPEGKAVSHLRKIAPLQGRTNAASLICRFFLMKAHEAR
jgi:hypothetical protein